MACRIVVCIDVDTESPEKAYERVYDFLAGLPKDMEWESSDEWFDSEGNPIDEDRVQGHRMTVFAKKDIKGGDAT